MNTHEGDKAKITVNSAGQIFRTFKKLRELRGLTQTEAAELIGMKQPRLSVLETGALGGTTLKTVFNIASALGFDVSITFESKEDPVLRSKTPYADAMLTQYFPGVTFTDFERRKINKILVAAFEKQQAT